MRLQTKLFLIFAVAVTLPLAAAGAVTWHSITQEFAEYYEARLDQANNAVRLVYSDLISDEQARLANLCEGDPFLENALVKIAHPQPDPELESRLEAWAQRQATTLDFDTLDVIGRDGVVLASAHYAGRRGEPAPRLAELARQSRGRALIAPITRHERGEGEQESLTLLTSCSAQHAGETVHLLGGRLVDETLAERITSRLGLGDVFVFVLDENREPIGQRQRWQESSRLRRVLVQLVNPDEQIPAWFAIAVDDSRELRAVNKIVRSIGMVLIASIIISWLLGVLLARSIGRPLARLAKQARVVAGGELGGTVTVRAGGEVRDLVDAFNRMSVDLKESRDRLVQAERIAAWRDIARRIAHEIKNPLFPIQTSIETVRKAYNKKHPEFDEIFDEATVTILEEVERMKRIVTEFSRFARLPKPAPEAVELDELINHTVSLYAGHDVAVEVTVPEGLSPVNADREQLTQVLHNLIKNAVEATVEANPEAGKVSVTAMPSPPSEGVTIIVSDNGPGMNEETAKRIFEPYFTTKERTGTGLGLAIVHRIITDHGGTITVDSAPNEGTTFRLFLTNDGPPPPRPSTPPEKAS